MRIKASLEDQYVPRFNDNRELPSEEQIVVTILRPTAAQRESLKGYQIEAGTGMVKVAFSTDKILRTHVTKITNLEDELNGTVREIRNGADLADSKNPKLARLVDELKAEVTKEMALDEDEQGN